MKKNMINIELDKTTYTRVKNITNKLNSTSDSFIQKAIISYLEVLENNNKSKNFYFLDQKITEHKKNIESEIFAIKDKKLSAINKNSNKYRNLIKQILPQSDLRYNTTSYWYISESEAIKELLDYDLQIPKTISKSIDLLANKIINKIRNQKRNSHKNIAQDLLQEFSLSTKEGIALMCLTEALLRVPDKSTKNDLISDKITNKNWKIHLGNKKSLFVKATILGLLINSKILSYKRKFNINKLLYNFISKIHEPLLVKGMNIAMKFIGKQFVIGECIEQALFNSKRLEKIGFRYSYDMLGEAALTNDDAENFLHSYQEAIHAIGKYSNGRGIYEGPGISIKLSALHPRYCRTQYERVIQELYPRLLHLTLLARHYDIGINIDAEESDRLEISLDLLSKLCFEPKLSGWNGIGFVVQAYQKRCIKVIDELISLAKNSKRRLMIRLVKGAYWDSEIKKSQENGTKDYPVFTRKVYTDFSYLICANRLLSETQYIYPQFATHNAYTLSSIYYFAGRNFYQGQYEFQCLQGMGESLYTHVVGNKENGELNRPCRIYAPVGTHKTLLPYLVRRLLENGANTSFVNLIADINVPLKMLLVNPFKEIMKLADKEGCIGLPHPKIYLPRNLYGKERLNSIGLNLSNEHHLASLVTSFVKYSDKYWKASPIIADRISNGSIHLIHNPADYRDIVGQCQHSTFEDIEHAISIADQKSITWANKSSSERSIILKKIADRLEGEMKLFISILIREAGKNFNNAMSEVRESIDFLRYYAYQASLNFNDNCNPLGPVVCISPWNFPLAIFTGQITAALSVGNTVLAKPAEQTPLVSAKLVELMLDSGIPNEALQFLPGSGEIVGSTLISDSRIKGVLFTGSTKVSKFIQRTLSERLSSKGDPIPLIAETGGINVMIVDSSALIEQVVTDVVTSAFDSSGQRCSALRLLCIQEDIADKTIKMIRGAITECKQGNPKYISTDIGPVINSKAKEKINNHISLLRKKGNIIWQKNISNTSFNSYGNFVPLTLIELNNISELKEEIFGPVLHIVRYNRNNISNIVKEINNMNYGLTLGLHTRVDKTMEYIIRKVNVGNLYVNRNTIGAVVGVQPFGGEGLSGTGPKAGGPLYLYNLVSNYNCNSTLPSLGVLNIEKKINIIKENKLEEIRSIFSSWVEVRYPTLLKYLLKFKEISQSGHIRTMNGPTGEKNSYLLLPRKHVLCLSNSEHDLIMQLAAVISIGAKTICQDSCNIKSTLNKLPNIVQNYIILVKDWTKCNIKINTILFHGELSQLKDILKKVVSMSGPLISVNNYKSGDYEIALEKLLLERTITINTTAAGGNTSLMRDI